MYEGSKPTRSVSRTFEMTGTGYSGLIRPKAHQVRSLEKDSCGCSNQLDNERNSQDIGHLTAPSKVGPPIAIKSDPRCPKQVWVLPSIRIRPCPGTGVTPGRDLLYQLRRAQSHAHRTEYLDNRKVRRLIRQQVEMFHAYKYFEVSA